MSNEGETSGEDKTGDMTSNKDWTVEIVSKALCATFSAKGISYNFFIKPDEQSEVYFDFAAARKSA